MYASSKISNFSGEYRWLSNFWFCEVELDGVWYPSVENAYQAAKFVDPSVRLKFRDIKPGQAKRLAREMSDSIRPDWSLIKTAIMSNLLEQKFQEGSVLAEFLINTGDAILIEGNTWGDTFWGVCDGVGKNWLGALLMGIRAELKNFGRGVNE